MYDAVHLVGDDDDDNPDFLGDGQDAVGGAGGAGGGGGDDGHDPRGDEDDDGDGDRLPSLVSDDEKDDQPGGVQMAAGPAGSQGGPCAGLLSSALGCDESFERVDGRSMPSGQPAEQAAERSDPVGSSTSSSQHDEARPNAAPVPSDSAPLPLARRVFREAASFGRAAERLWKQEAIHHVKKCVAEASSQAVFSIGPTTGPPSVFAVPLKSLVDPEPELESGSFSFHCVTAPFGSAKSDLAAAKIEIDGVIFFSCVIAKPSAKRVVAGAPCISDSSAMCIVIRELLGVDHNSKTATLAAEAADGTSLTPTVLSLSALQPDELASISRWTSSDLRCQMLLPAQVGCRSDLDAVVSALLGVGAMPSQDGPLLRVSHDESSTLRVLSHLESIACVRRCWDNDAASGWQLTEEGIRRLQLFHTIAAPMPVLAVRADEWACVEDFTTFQLMCALCRQGWSAKLVHEPEKVCNQIPFKYGVENSQKFWYIAGEAQRIQRAYLLALYLAGRGDIARAVEHGKQVSYYSALIDGKPIVIRTRGSRFKFGQVDTAPFVRRTCRPAGKKRARRLAGPDVDLEQSSSGSDAASDMSDTSDASGVSVGSGIAPEAHDWTLYPIPSHGLQHAVSYPRGRDMIVWHTCTQGSIPSRQGWDRHYMLDTKGRGSIW